MRPHVKFILSFIVILFISLTSFTPASQAVDDAILAVVNDELITLKDLKNYIHGTYVAMMTEGKSKEEVDKTMLDLEINGLNKLIEDKLFLSKANEMGLIVRDKLITDRIADIKKRYRSEQEFIEALNKSGGTLSDIREKINDQFKITFLIENEIKSKIFVNPQEVTQFYNLHIEQFQKKEKVIVKSIFIPFDSDKDNALKQANLALDMIKKGEDFDSVAKQYSKSPSLGTVERGQLLPQVEKTIFHLPLGENSEIIEVVNGLYIFQISQKFPAELAPIEDVKEFITNQIFNEKFKERFLVFLEKLKKDAYIEIKK
ncbi:MAG: peptidyl-prolyl cis-trans isomerase [Candidatus Omnitrophica bacterium]|nr:peptidyl-prolyl cis-trans isomerase [Candidatus Omnitrophota bacterium]